MIASGALLASLGLHRPSGRDVGIVLSLFLTGTVTGLLYCLFYAGTPGYYQQTFGPAVMFASGHGFVNPDTRRAPKVWEFLTLQRDRLSRDDIEAYIPTIPFHVYQRGTRYLLFSVGLWWRIVGISWHQVAAVNAVLYGVATVSFYAILRLALPRLFAVFGTLVLCFSATQLENLVHLRDYAKAPFILASIAIIGTLAFRSIPRTRLLYLSALCGIVLGIGTGFRIDVDTFVPIFVLALLFFHADKPWHSLPAKLMALALFVLSFAVCAGPVLVGISSSGTALSHVILLGLMDPFDASLGIQPSIYSLGYHYSDELVERAVGGYAERIHGVSAWMHSPTYGRMGSQYLLTVAREFPADMLTRFFGSVVGVLELPFTVFPTYHLDPRIPFQEPVARIYQHLSVFSGLGVPLALLLLGAAALTRLKYGLFGVFAVLSLCGLPSLQFDLRHYFHLQFISLLSLLLLAHFLLRGAGRVLREGRTLRGTSPWIGHARGRLAELWHTSRPDLPPAIRAAGRVSLMGLLIVTLSLLPIWCLRRYQESHLTRLFRTYLSADRQEIRPVASAANDGRALLTWDGVQGRAFGPGHFLTDYYVLEWVSDRELAVGEIRLKYRARWANEDFSRTVPVILSKGVSRFFFPVFSSGRSELSRFLGLEVSEELRGRLRGIFRVTELTDKPLLLDVHLAPDWERERLFQTLSRWEAPAPGPHIVYASVPPGSAFASEWVNRLSPTSLRTDGMNIEWMYAPMMKADGSHLLGDGRVYSRFHYLVQFKKLAIPQGALLVVRGRLERGGLAIGLLKDNTWYNQVRLDQPGEFVAAVEVGEAGTFVPLITNATAGAWTRSRFTITDVGILDPKGPR